MNLELIYKEDKGYFITDGINEKDVTEQIKGITLFEKAERKKNQERKVSREKHLEKQRKMKRPLPHNKYF